ncbi:hypothetical protein TNCT6_65710 [Streptomyces sp. 6-11-2]|nr:hypothetical protein TNCT6_65710 [Streptomyces sp. 6-11-2]
MPDLDATARGLTADTDVDRLRSDLLVAVAQAAGRLAELLRPGRHVDRPSAVRSIDALIKRALATARRVGRLAGDIALWDQEQPRRVPVCPYEYVCVKPSRKRCAPATRPR